MFAPPNLPSDTPQPGTEQTTAIDLSGLDLFFGNFEHAKVYLPGFSFASRADRGLRDVSISRNSGEEALFWITIESPPVNPSIIKSRQGLIIDLREHIQSTKSIHSEIGKRSVLQHNLTILFTIPTSEYGRSDNAPRNNLEILIQEHGVTSENIQSKLTELSQAQPSSHHRDQERPAPVDIIRGLLYLEPVRQGIIAAIKKISDFEDPNLKAISTSLLASAEALGEITSERVILAAPDEPQRLELAQRVSDFNEQLSKFGMLCSFANLAQADGYCLCTFDESKDDGYKEAWNMLREKNGNRGDSNGKDVPPQVTCDSPSTKQHIVICGSNTAGKTFCGERDLSLRLVAQSFGLAPASQANIHIADSFIRVDRTSPASSEVLINGVKKKPSDFAREVLVRREAYPKIGARCRWYSDESWTTTSPNYEFLLNVAEAIFLKSKNVRLFTITHNTEALKFWSDQTDTSIHHFRVDESDGKNPKFTRELAEGIDTSRAFEVALDLGIHQQFVEFARRYLNGQYTVERPDPRNTKVAAYSSDERTRLKQSAQSLRSLVPQSDELVQVEDSNKRIFVRWRSLNDRLRSPDSDRSMPLPIGHRAWGNRYRFPFSVISNNNDHFLAFDRKFPFTKGNRFKDDGFIYGFIKHGATNDPNELIERRKLFTELAHDGVIERLGDKLTDLNTTLMHVANAGAIKLGDYPQALLEAIDYSLQKLRDDTSQWHYSRKVEALKLVRMS